MKCRRCKQLVDECECDDIGECDVICSKCGSEDVKSFLSMMEYGHVVTYVCKKCGNSFLETL